MVKHSKLFTTIAATALLSAGLAAQAAAQTIKIGVNEPLTGPFAASGTYVVNGAKIAADEINAKGGVLGKKIELVIEDNKSNPTEAAAVAEKLITADKVPVMMGAWGSSLTLAVMPKLMEYKVPMVVETSSSGKITTTAILTSSASRRRHRSKLRPSRTSCQRCRSRRPTSLSSTTTGDAAQLRISARSSRSTTFRSGSSRRWTSPLRT